MAVASGLSVTALIAKSMEGSADAAITATYGDGARRPVGTGHEGGIVTVANAGAIILELQDRISELETELGELTRASAKARAGVVDLHKAAPKPGQLLITLPPEVLQLMPGDDKVATIEAHLIERFGYGMYRVKQLLKPEEKKGKGK